MDIIEKIERVERAIYNITEAIEEMKPIKEMKPIDTGMCEYWEDDVEELRKLVERLKKQLERENRK